jgi:hypothetical protein
MSARPTNTGTSTTLQVDWTTCDGLGVCVELLPRVAGGDDWGYPATRDGSREATRRGPCGRPRPRPSPSALVSR